MAKTRLYRIRDLQREIDAIQVRIDAERAQCQHRFRLMTCIPDVSKHLTPVDGVYSGDEPFEFNIYCQRCDLCQYVTDQDICPLCLQPMSKKEPCRDLHSHQCFPNHDSQWYMEHLFNGRYCSNPDCHYGRVWYTDRGLAHF